jgi:hypothetical protein
MAVYKSKDPFRVKPWCADVYKGSTRVKKYFATKHEADKEHAALTQSPVSKKGWDKIKVRDFIERYRDEITPTKPEYKRDNPEKIMRHIGLIVFSEKNQERHFAATLCLS